jgi:hypothetical protein
MDDMLRLTLTWMLVDPAQGQQCGPDRLDSTQGAAAPAARKANALLDFIS